LRTLIYLGVKGDSLATIAEIAESFDVSRPHLMKVVNRLGAQGYIDTIRGRRGGMKLARPPAQIRVGAVIRDTEDDLAVMGCLSGPEFLCRGRSGRGAA
jgi:Rrf2 family transcriptional regulator, nitric oxide-sensitive transcriptional repressor